MQNLLLVTDDLVDQCSFYRLIGPYAEFRNECHVRAISTESLKTEDLWLTDVVVFGRPSTELSLSCISKARELDKHVIVDYDDDFFNFPDYHPSSERFTSIKQRRVLEQIGMLASVMTVSTKAIALSWFAYTGEIKVIPNAFNDSLYALPVTNNNDSDVIVWRGSSTHRKDLELLEDSRMKIHFLGNVSHEMKKRFPNAVFHPYMPMRDYFKTLRGLRPKLFLVPLQDHLFNHAKSNCAWIEATHAGALTLASVVAEFKQPGVFSSSFSAAHIEQLMGLDLSEHYSQTLNAIPHLSVVNCERRSLLHSLR